MQYPVNLKLADGSTKTFWLSDEPLQFGGESPDVRIGGQSIVADGVAEIPLAGRGVKGLSALDYQYGIWKMSDGSLCTYGANDAQADAKNDAFCPIMPARIDRAVRAGLLSNSQITDEDKPAICATLGAEPNGPMRLIYSSTLDSDTKGIVIISDTSGNALSLHRFIVDINFRNQTAVGYLSVGINHDTASYDGAHVLIAREVSKSTSGNTEIMVDAQCLNGVARATFAFCQNIQTQSQSATTLMAAPKFVFAETVTSITIAMYQANAPIPAGSVVKVYGA